MRDLTVSSCLFSNRCSPTNRLPFLQGFYLYLYSVSLIFLAYVYVYLLQDSSSERRKSIDFPLRVFCMSAARKETERPETKRLGDFVRPKIDTRIRVLQILISTANTSESHLISSSFFFLVTQGTVKSPTWGNETPKERQATLKGLTVRSFFESEPLPLVWVPWSIMASNSVLSWRQGLHPVTPSFWESIQSFRLLLRLPRCTSSLRIRASWFTNSSWLRVWVSCIWLLQTSARGFELLGRKRFRNSRTWTGVEMTRLLQAQVKWCRHQTTTSTVKQRT